MLQRDPAHLDGIGDPVLAQRLKKLEAAQLILCTVVPTTPVQVRYTLTEKGGELLRSLIPLILWRQKWEPAPVPEELPPA